MTLAEAQQETRSAFLGGAIGQIVTGVIWLLSAALATWGAPAVGMVSLFVGGMLIFPLTQAALRAGARSGRLSADNPLGRFPLQMVFAMTALYPLIYVATLYQRSWFFPAFMIVVGSHYVSFILLYGCKPTRSWPRFWCSPAWPSA
jgi:hypothetical protein